VFKRTVGLLHRLGEDGQFPQVYLAALQSALGTFRSFSCSRGLVEQTHPVPKLPSSRSYPEPAQPPRHGRMPPEIQITWLALAGRTLKGWVLEPLFWPACRRQRSCSWSLWSACNSAWPQLFLRAFLKRWWEPSTAGTAAGLYNACLELDTLGKLVKTTTKKSLSVSYTSWERCPISVQWWDGKEGLGWGQVLCESP